MNLRRRFPILAAAVMLVLAVGCEHEGTAPELVLKNWREMVRDVHALKAETSQDGLPGIIIGIADDISGSAGSTNIRRITLGDLEPAIKRIQRTGGEIAVATISSRPDEGLLRLRVQPPPILPPTLQGFDETTPTKKTLACLLVLDSLIYTDINTCNKKGPKGTTSRDEALHVRELFKTLPSDIAQSRENYKQWQDATKKALDEFNPLAKTLLTRPIEGNTDLCTPLNRLALFVKEPSVWLAESAVIRALILSTDGEETVRPGCPLPQLPNDTDFYLINCATPCALDPLKPHKYEAFTAALQAVVISKKVSTR